VRLPKGVFAPYTSINTNLLFFTKGRPTSEVWYYEHAYPSGQRSYSKTKPIRIEEFAPAKAWWNERTENEHAWRVSIEEVRRRGYNLNITNPTAASKDHRDPDVLLLEYQQAVAEAEETREQLKAALSAALDSPLVAGVNQ
jgi:type I restriction enzyme M protein